MTAQTITALKRWSCARKELPSISSIKTVHVYDFDNTLFRTPLPNSRLWAGATLGRLQREDGFLNGGWWHDPGLLASTGEGIEKEEPRGWEGWWNEEVASLARLSEQQPDALSVLLTGRSEQRFADLIKRIATSKQLEFDMVCLKPEAGPSNQKFTSTLDFKQALFKDLLFTYTGAEEIRVYEDRPRHVESFRTYLTSISDSLQVLGDHPRNPFVSEIVPVAELATTLNPTVEVSQVQRMVNEHNAELPTLPANSPASRLGRVKIKRTVYYTGYLISPEDTERLLTATNVREKMGVGKGEEKKTTTLANNIMIAPRPCPRSILDKAGGMGHQVRWQVTGLGSWEGKIWAALVKPVPDTAKYYVESPAPIVVLAKKRGARTVDANKIQRWNPVSSPDQAITFNTTVGEKVLLRVDEETPDESNWQSLFPSKQPQQRRKRGFENEPGGRPQHQGPRSARGALRGGGRGGGGGGGPRGSYRGGRGGGSGVGGGGVSIPPSAYRSLDDAKAGQEFRREEMQY